MSVCKCSKCGCIGEERKEISTNKKFFYPKELYQARDIVNIVRAFIKDPTEFAFDALKQQVLQYNNLFK